MSKGDNPRPLSIPPEEFEERWEQTFGCRESVADNENCHGNGTDDTLIGTTFWSCAGCGEAINGRTARTHECEGEEDGNG